MAVRESSPGRGKTTYNTPSVFTRLDTLETEVGGIVVPDVTGKADKTYVDSQDGVLSAQLAESTQRGKNIWVDAKQDYGAVGDGVNDDSTAIQNALGYVSALPTGGVVYLPPGKYRINQPLWMGSNATLRGAGMGVTIILPYGNISAIQGGGTASTPIVNVEISYLTIDGTNANPTGGYTPGVKGVWMSYLKRFRMLYCRVYNTYATGIGTDFLINSVIHGCITENCGRGAIGQTVVGSNGIGIGTGWATETESLVISDCYALNGGNNGIMFENQEGTASKYDGYAKVIGCTAIGNLIGFRDSGNMRLEFIGNTAKSNTQHGFVLSGGVNSGAQGYVAKETMITNNVITNNTKIGIYIMKASTDGAFMILNNRIAENGTAGIDSDVPIYNSKINGNMVYKNGTHGIFLWESAFNTDINENHIYLNQNNGIYLVDGGSRIDVRGNKVFDNGLINTGSADQDGIRILTTTANLSELRVHNNKCFDEQTTKTQRRGLTVGLASGATGTISNIVVENNDFQGNNLASLSVSGSSVKVRNNVGYNPVGISLLTVGASPWTYTAGSSPELIYIDGGTVSLIQKNGTQVFTTTNKTVYLEPNETVTITYSSAPTVKTDVH